jgi:hypothetical protein
VLEDLEIRWGRGFLVRLVRYGMPVEPSSRRYELAAFTFLIPAQPVRVYEKDEFAQPVQITGRRALESLILWGPGALARFMGQVVRCQVLLGGNPLDLDGFFQGGRVHRISKDGSTRGDHALSGKTASSLREKLRPHASRHNRNPGESRSNDGNNFGRIESCNGRPTRNRGSERHPNE